MKSKVFIVSANNLNSGIQTVDVSLYVSSYPNDKGEVVVENVYYYPKQIIIDNQNSIEIGYICLDTFDLSIYNSRPEYYDWIPIKAVTEVNSLSAPKTKNIKLIKLENKTLTKDIRIVCIGYNK